MERVQQFSVVLPNEKGQLAALGRSLADAGVNIMALSVLESTELGTVRLVVDKPDEAASALEEADMQFATMEVLLAAMPNKVGVLAEAAEKLADSGVNIHFVYGSTAEGSAPAHIVIGCDQKASAEQALAEY